MTSYGLRFEYKGHKFTGFTASTHGAIGLVMIAEVDGVDVWVTYEPELMKEDGYREDIYQRMIDRATIQKEDKRLKKIKPQCHDPKIHIENAELRHDLCQAKEYGELVDEKLRSANLQVSALQEALGDTVAAWAENWDCSANPGHGGMNDAIHKAEKLCRVSNVKSFEKVLDEIEEEYGGALKKLADNPIDHTNDSITEGYFENCMKCKKRWHVPCECGFPFPPKNLGRGK